ncbi:MAG TPA: HDOD domain-containing protein [Holophagaceae bacterium]
MRKRILFVDDDALVLKGLERSLRSLRGDWDMAFVQEGAEALSRLDEGAFDVVVSDLQMPGMSGVELLSRVKARYPSVVRMALSGQADRETAFRCLEVAHQYLSKPCDPGLLKARIRQAGTLGRGLPRPLSGELAGLTDHLPVLPPAYQRLKVAADSGLGEAEELERVLEEHPEMGVRLLQTVNSGISGPSPDVRGPNQAAARLGMGNVRALILAHGLFEQMGDLGTPSLIREAVWAHSLGVAAGARAIMELEGVPGCEADEAFLAGLLHDAGILVLASMFGHRYEEVLAAAVTEGVEVEEVERRTFGATHSGVGAHLLGLWRLPERVVEAVAWHHGPSWSGQTAFGPLTAVHAADTIGAKTGEHPVFERTFVDNYHLLVVGKQDRLHVWRGALNGAVPGTGETR